MAMAMQAFTDIRPALVPGVLRRHWLLFSLILLHALVALFVGLIVKEPYQPDIIRELGRLFLAFTPPFLVFLAVYRLSVLCLRLRSIRRVLPVFAQDLRGLATDVDRLLQGAVILLALSVFSSAKMFLKSSIPDIIPFSLDPTFMALDRFLHGGVDPYQLLMPCLAHPVPNMVINAAYVGWIVLVCFCMFLAAFSRDDRPNGDGGAGRTYLLGYILIWMFGGNLMALLFSSAGPVFYQNLGLGDHFVPLRATLETVHAVSPVWALEIQDALWARYAEGMNVGISAMPSMHLATSTLMALYAFRHSRALGLAMCVFVGLILVGSVYLGWHYAVDGYAGILLGIAGWYFGWRLAVWSHRMPVGFGRADGGPLPEAQTR